MRHQRIIPGSHIEKFSLIALSLAGMGDGAVEFVSVSHFVVQRCPLGPHTVRGLSSVLALGYCCITWMLFFF